MSGASFYAQVLLILAAAVVIVGYFIAQLADPFDEDAITADPAGDDQRARCVEHHHNKHVLHAQLAPGEEGSKGFKGGVVDMFHALKSLFLAFFPSGK
jgi:hypothetical protein